MIPALAARGVSYTIGSAAIVEDISLQVEEGEIVAIVGPNGAGKSTLLQLLAGELEPTSGRIELRGKALAKLSAHEIALERAVMPQHTTLQFAFTVEAVVAMGRHPHQTPTAVDVDVVSQAMRDADIAHLAARKYTTLSGGERQRVTFARILAQQAPLLLLDEPTSSLDLHHQEHLMTLAQAAVGRGGTVVTVLHDLNLAAAYADQIVLLDHGRLVAAGTPAHVYTTAPLDRIFEHPLTIGNDPQTGYTTVTPVRSRNGSGAYPAILERSRAPTI